MRSGALSPWYSETAKVNRNVFDPLAAHRARLEPYPAVTLEGALFHGPWVGAAKTVAMESGYPVLPPAKPC